MSHNDNTVHSMERECLVNSNTQVNKTKQPCLFKMHQASLEISQEFQTTLSLDVQVMAVCHDLRAEVITEQIAGLID